MRCESCRSGDSQCNAWIACDGPVLPLVLVANLEALSPPPLVAVDRAGCRRCGTPLPPVDVARDEDRDVVVAAAECRVCGWERPETRMDGPEIRAWLRRRLGLLGQQRKR